MNNGCNQLSWPSSCRGCTPEPRSFDGCTLLYIARIGHGKCANAGYGRLPKGFEVGCFEKTIPEQFEGGEIQASQMREEGMGFRIVWRRDPERCVRCPQFDWHLAQPARCDGWRHSGREQRSQVWLVPRRSDEDTLRGRLRPV